MLTEWDVEVVSFIRQHDVWKCLYNQSYVLPFWAVGNLVLAFLEEFLLMLGFFSEELTFSFPEGGEMFIFCYERTVISPSCV